MDRWATAIGSLGTYAEADLTFFKGTLHLVPGFRVEPYVVSVNKALPNDGAKPDVTAAERYGLRYVHLPVGYDGIPGIVNVPARDPAAAAAVLRGLETAAESKLLEMQSANWQLLDRHYTWDRFAAQVADAIESGESPRLGPESLKRRLQFGFYEMTSPHGRLPYSPPARLVSRLRRAIGRPRTTRGVK